MGSQGHSSTEPCNHSNGKGAWAFGQFARFLIVGAFNTVVVFIAFAFLIYLGLPPEVALLITVIANIALGFLLTGYAVFGNKDPKRIYKYILAAIVLYIVNALALRILSELGLHPTIAQAFLTPFVVLTSFLLQRFFVFRVTSKQ
jgi:putative flippase GtrA